MGSMTDPCACDVSFKVPARSLAIGVGIGIGVGVGDESDCAEAVNVRESDKGGCFGNAVLIAFEMEKRLTPTTLVRRSVNSRHCPRSPRASWRRVEVHPEEIFGRLSS